MIQPSRATAWSLALLYVPVQLASYNLKANTCAFLQGLPHVVCSSTFPLSCRLCTRSLRRTNLRDIMLQNKRSGNKHFKAQALILAGGLEQLLNSTATSLQHPHPIHTFERHMFHLDFGLEEHEDEKQEREGKEMGHVLSLLHRPQWCLWSHPVPPTPATIMSLMSPSESQNHENHARI